MNNRYLKAIALALLSAGQLMAGNVTFRNTTPQRLKITVSEVTTVGASGTLLFKMELAPGEIKSETLTPGQYRFTGEIPELGEVVRWGTISDLDTNLYYGISSDKKVSIHRYYGNLYEQEKQGVYRTA